MNKEKAKKIFEGAAKRVESSSRTVNYTCAALRSVARHLGGEEINIIYRDYLTVSERGYGNFCWTTDPEHADLTTEQRQLARCLMLLMVAEAEFGDNR